MGIYGGTTLFYGKVDDGNEVVNSNYKTLEYNGKKYLYHKDGYLTTYTYCDNIPSVAVIRAFQMTFAEYELNIPGFVWMYYYEGSDTYGPDPSSFNSYSSDIKIVQLPERTDKINTQLEVFGVLRSIEKFSKFNIRQPCTVKDIDICSLQFQEIKEFLIKHNENTLNDIRIKWLNKLEDDFLTLV